METNCIQNPPWELARASVRDTPAEHLMNVSGPSIAAAARKRGVPPDALVVLSDSAEVEPCRLKYRLGGSANGHNGLKSVIGALGTPAFHRVRLGVGRHPAMDLSDFVLGKLSAHERQFWSGDGADLVCGAIERIAKTVEG